MPHKAQSSLEPALGHGMPLLLQVACHVLNYAIGCNMSFQFWDSDYFKHLIHLKTGALAAHGSILVTLYWVMYALTSHALWGVQLVSNKENVNFKSKGQSALFQIQLSAMLMAITSEVCPKSVWYLVWRMKRTLPISIINKTANDGNIAVKLNTWIWVSILFVNAVVIGGIGRCRCDNIQRLQSL